MRTLMAALVLTLLFSTAAQGYPIDLEVRSQGLDVEVLEELLGVATVVRLINHEAFAVRCDVRFDNGPEIGRVRLLRRVVMAISPRSSMAWAALTIIFINT